MLAWHSRLREGAGRWFILLHSPLPPEDRSSGRDRGMARASGHGPTICLGLRLEAELGQATGTAEGVHEEAGSGRAGHSQPPAAQAGVTGPVLPDCSRLPSQAGLGCHGAAAGWEGLGTGCWGRALLSRLRLCDNPAQYAWMAAGWAAAGWAAARKQHHCSCRWLPWQPD